MLHLDISAATAKLITSTAGIPEQEFTLLRTNMRRYIEDWLKERSRGQHAWSMDPYDRKAIERVREAAVRARGEGIQTILWIGIGGSGLGPTVLQEVFEGPETPAFIVMDSLDPAVLASYLAMVNWKTTMVVVASKSGDTLEPMSIFFLCYRRLKEAMGRKAAERVIAVTDPEKGHLRAFCLQEGIPMLPIPPGVGGRYSIFTPIGLLPMALLNADLDRFIRGAKEMDTLCQKTNIENNPAALLAATQFLLESKRGYRIRVIMPYSERLRSIARWNQQLIAESLGKNETHNPIPSAAIGTQDQHSLLQQWMAGPRAQWHLFIRDIEKPHLAVPRDIPEPFGWMAGKSFGELFDACYEGTSRALLSVKRPSATISITRLDAYHLGQLFFLLLAEVVFLGKLYRIDPYGQPAVETGKNITKELLMKGKMM
ncbi:MAG: glucose-6-phosphate isomerase [Candidatus Peregrinibacteria bacterium Greene0416_19]|nr:MAG: glucose-6-phosphate isomerase [Candidatus Peregrinibacteria bacterium Greene0416_19]